MMLAVAPYLQPTLALELMQLSSLLSKDLYDPASSTFGERKLDPAFARNPLDAARSTPSAAGELEVERHATSGTVSLHGCEHR